MFFKFKQNNSGGRFDVNENLCHILIIESQNFQDALKKAEELGCYWNGVEEGIDCECCGDRWNQYCDVLSFPMKREVILPETLDFPDTCKTFPEKYAKYEKDGVPHYRNDWSGNKVYSGTLILHTPDEYAQFITEEYIKWTTPNVRIFYLDGTIHEI